MTKGAWNALAIMLMALLFVLVVTGVSWPEGEMDDVSNEDLATTLFGEQNTEGYALVVFLVGLLLLVAMLGGVFLAKEEKE
jgi:NADH:ubiquinone oxidoreductase subunit 6 (subunit J)